jgi:hypothetical protein
MEYGDKIREIKGMITLVDGSTSEFSLNDDLGYSQWGALMPRLGKTVDALQAAAEALEPFWLSEDDVHPDDIPPERSEDCEGHESLAGAHMGQTVYCDGSCKP